MDKYQPCLTDLLTPQARSLKDIAAATITVWLAMILSVRPSLEGIVLVLPLAISIGAIRPQLAGQVLDAALQ